MEFLGKYVTKILVFEYDKKAMIPLLVKVNKFLNPTSGKWEQCTTNRINWYRFCLLDAPTSIDEANEAMLTSKLFLFHGMIVSKEKVVQPLTWWEEYFEKNDYPWYEKLVNNHDYFIHKDLFIRYSNVHFKQIHQGAKLSIILR
jgi:hypothetical protein